MSKEVCILRNHGKNRWQFHDSRNLPVSRSLIGPLSRRTTNRLIWPGHTHTHQTAVVPLSRPKRRVASPQEPQHKFGLSHQQELGNGEDTGIQAWFTRERRATLMTDRSKMKGRGRQNFTGTGIEETGRHKSPLRHRCNGNLISQQDYPPTIARPRAPPR